MEFVVGRAHNEAPRVRAIILVRLLLGWVSSTPLKMTLCVSVGTFARMWSRYRMPKVRMKLRVFMCMLVIWVLSVLGLMMELNRKKESAYINICAIISEEREKAKRKGVNEERNKVSTRSGEWWNDAEG